MKPGRAPWRVYDPSCLCEVDELRVTRHGVVGLLPDGSEVLDVHHTDHPQSRDRRGRAGVSVLSTGDYRALRGHFGDHLVNGVAGEGVLVDYPPGLARRRMPESVTVRRGPRPGLPATGGSPEPSGEDAELGLHAVHIADPCVEFTRFCLRLPASDVVSDEVRQGLVDLGGGARGYKMIAERDWVLRRGDLLIIRLGD